MLKSLKQLSNIFLGNLQSSEKLNCLLFCFAYSVVPRKFMLLFIYVLTHLRLFYSNCKFE